MKSIYKGVILGCVRVANKLVLTLRFSDEKVIAAESLNFSQTVAR